MNDPDHSPTPATALLAALSVLAGGLRPDGPHADGCPEGERTGGEWRALHQWCGKKGLCLGPEIIPERIGGREHDVRFCAADRRWLKFTKWNSAGFTVDLETGEPLFLPAAPSCYLERLRLQNEYFGDDWQLLGIQADGHDLRLVTSQPDIVGEAPTVDELDHHMRETFGFHRLAIPPMGYHKSLSYLSGSLGLFDVHPANAVMTPEGVLVPIDFILVEFDRADQARLEARLEA